MVQMCFSKLTAVSGQGTEMHQMHTLKRNPKNNTETDHPWVASAVEAARGVLAVAAADG